MATSPQDDARPQATPEDFSPPSLSSHRIGPRPYPFPSLPRHTNQEGEIPFVEEGSIRMGGMPMNLNLQFQEALELHQAGKTDAATYKLWNYIKRNLDDEIGWLVYANITPDAGERRRCLERVLAINPRNLEAKRWLEEIKAREAAFEWASNFVDQEDPILK